MFNCKVLISALALMTLSLGSIACGQSKRSIPVGPQNQWPHPRQGDYNHRQPHDLSSIQHQVGQKAGKIDANSLEAAEYLLQEELSALAGIRFRGAIEIYDDQPTSGYLSMGFYEQADGSTQPHELNFNLIPGADSRTTETGVTLKFEGKYGKLFLRGSMTSDRQYFEGNSFFAATGDEEWSPIGSFLIHKCSFFTCNLVP